jgi:hypothetical protein
MTARGNALASAADEALREAQTQTGHFFMDTSTASVWLSDTQQPKICGSGAEFVLVRESLKGVWKRGWGAGVLALLRNLRCTAGVRGESLCRT